MLVVTPTFIDEGSIGFENVHIAGASVCSQVGLIVVTTMGHCINNANVRNNGVVG